MRTTIEMKDEHRAALMEIAGRRGKKGFSSVVAEAIDTYLKETAKRAAVRRSASALRGTLTEKEAEDLRRRIRRMREFWR